MAEPWNEHENRAVVRAYFMMLKAHQDGRTINKTEVIQKLAGAINRTQGAVQFKLQNVSAVLDEMSIGWVPGVPPLHHYQGSLAEEVRRQLSGSRPAPSISPKEKETFAAPEHDDEPGRLNRLLSADHQQLKAIVIQVISDLPKQSCAKKHLVREICRRHGVQSLRGPRRREFTKAINKAVGALKSASPPLVKEYKASLNVRLRLLAPPITNPTTASAKRLDSGIGDLGPGFIGIRPWVVKLLIECPDCADRFAVSLPVSNVECSQCQWSPGRM